MTEIEYIIKIIDYITRFKMTDSKDKPGWYSVEDYHNYYTLILMTVQFPHLYKNTCMNHPAEIEKCGICDRYTDKFRKDIIDTYYGSFTITCTECAKL